MIAKFVVFHLDNLDFWGSDGFLGGSFRQVLLRGFSLACFKIFNNRIQT